MNLKSYRDTWAEVSLDAIQNNVRQFKHFIQGATKMMAVVKANGYGHGTIEVARASINAGADYLGVAILDEALELRDAGITEPILVLGPTSVQYIKTAIDKNITLTVFSHDVLNEIIHQANVLNKQAMIHIKIDTGMSRIGVTTKEEAYGLAIKAKSALLVRLEGIFTHFAIADGDDPTYTRMQYQRFMDIVDFLRREGIDIPLKHCCNSAATMKFPEMHLDMVRVGISLYGSYPGPAFNGHPIKLMQAMSLKTIISHIKTVPAGQPIGYGCTFTPSEDKIIATLPIGYADGVSRLLSNRGHFLVHGKAAPITGRVCMDQLMIDVTDIPNVMLGDEATLFGSSQGNFQSVDRIAELMGTITHEVVCLITKRVPRAYVSDLESFEETKRAKESTLV